MRVWSIMLETQLHNICMEQMRKLGSALDRHTGQEEGETISHLRTRASVLLQKGLSAHSGLVGGC